MTLVAHIHEIPPGHSLSNIAVDLTELAASSSTSNPFYHPAILSAATEHLSTCRTRLIIIEENGKPVGVLPIQARRGLPLYQQAFKHEYSFLHSPLYQSTEALGMCIMESLKYSPAGALLLPDISLSGRFHLDLYEALKGSGCSLLYFNRYERAGYLTPRSSDAVKLSKRHQKKLFKRFSRLGETRINPEIVAAHHRAFADQFLALEESGWKGRQKTALKSTIAGRNFLYSIFNNQSFTPHILCSELLYSGKALALSCTFIMGSSAFRFKTTYNEDYQQLSPGVILEMTILRALASKEYCIDGCCSPHAETMNRLYPDKITMASALILSGKGLWGKLLPSLIFNTKYLSKSFSVLGGAEDGQI